VALRRQLLLHLHFAQDKRLVSRSNFISFVGKLWARLRCACVHRLCIHGFQCAVVAGFRQVSRRGCTPDAQDAHSSPLLPRPGPAATAQPDAHHLVLRRPGEIQDQQIEWSRFTSKFVAYSNRLPVAARCCNCRSRYKTSQ
jgi:hypothetical protein